MLVGQEATTDGVTLLSVPPEGALPGPQPPPSIVLAAVPPSVGTAHLIVITWAQDQEEE